MAALRKEAQPTPPFTQLEQACACFRWQVWPWWVALLGCVYVLTKQHVLYESPCAVLGCSSPVTRADISKAYRSISMCTHPDRLVGSPELQARGVLLFKRVTSARDVLLDRVRANAAALQAAGLGGPDGPQPSASCMSSELEVYVYRLLHEVVGELGALRAGDVYAGLAGFFIGVITLESGLTHSISMCLLLLMLGRMLSAVLGALTSAPPLLLLAQVTSSLLIGPLPTVARFLLAPCVRIYVFARRALRGDAAEAAEGAPAAEGEAPAQPAQPLPPLAPGFAKAERASLPRHLRRKAPDKKLSSAEQERREQAALLGRGPGAQAEGAQDEAVAGKLAESGLGAMPSALVEIVSQRGPPAHVMSAAAARSKAAEVVQFDVLLALTKPIFPLLALLATGEAYNGLFFVMFTTRLLRQVPFLGVEGLHLFCFLSGLLHTLLGVSATAISAHQRGLLILSWGWSVKDVAMIANVALTGATFASLSRLGNEPLLTVSFASGLAARLLVLEHLPPAWLPDLNPQLAPLGVQFAPVAEQGVRSSGGVGSCAGGLFRWIGGDRYGALFALAAKAALVLLPLLSTAQWLVRAQRNSRKLHRAAARRRFAGSVALGLLAACQAALLLSFNLNSINGPLPNFWVACLLGALFESLLSTYNVLGRMRSYLGWILYIFL